MNCNFTYKNGVFYGSQSFVLPYHMNYGAYILERISKFKDKIALINGVTDERLTYQQFIQRVVNSASSLIKLGVTVDDVVGICSENRIECLVATCAVFAVGAAVTYFTSSYTENDLNHAINISRPKYMILSKLVCDTHYETLQKCNFIKGFILLDEVYLETKNFYFKEMMNNQVDIDTFEPVHLEGKIRTCLILYSSGTTGLAKGAKITNLNCIIASQQPPPTNKDLMTLTIAPWSSSMGFITTFQGLLNGKTTIIMPRFVEKLYLQVIEKYQVGYILVAPPLLVMLCKSKIAGDHDLSSLEVVCSGGAPLTLDVIRQFRERFPHVQRVIQGYGMTEATGALTFDTGVEWREGSVGRVVPGIILKIVDPETGKVLGCREPGEVCFKGPVLFDGYIGRNSDTDYYPDGFYRTGDIAYFDEDGFIFVIDRIKEIIKYNAWQVSPSELEALLLKHEAVKDAAVVGTPDPSAGELPTALVVTQHNARVTETDIVHFLDQKVASWKKLRGGVIFVDEIPKNANGKILRRKLKELILQKRNIKMPSKL